jgi:hypothetical protein
MYVYIYTRPLPVARILMYFDFDTNYRQIQLLFAPGILFFPEGNIVSQSWRSRAVTLALKHWETLSHNPGAHVL